ncbi:hypothetical protein FBU59_003170, partial [Linderina macrospora]
KGAGSIHICQISQQLELSKSARDSLALNAPARHLIKEGVFSVAEGGQVLVFLFDSSPIMATETKAPHAKGISRYITDKCITPISMLDATVPTVETGALMSIREVFGLQTGASLQTLPDALDDDFSFVAQLDSGQVPTVCKVGKEFLLCNEEFTFFIDSFLQCRHMETYVMLCIVRLHKAVCLNPDSKLIVLHVAVKPSGAGLITGTSSQSSATQSQASDKGSSTKAQPPVAAESSTANVVPGPASIDGTKTFPEGNANFYSYR